MISFIVLLAAALLLFGCGGEAKETNSGDNNETNSEENNNSNTEENNNNENNDQNDGEPEEATVSLMIHWGEEDFEKTFNQHVKKLFHT